MAIVRLFNVYGLGQSKAYAGVVTRFIERAVKGLPPIIYGDGKPQRRLKRIGQSKTHQLKHPHIGIVLDTRLKPTELLTI